MHDVLFQCDSSRMQHELESSLVHMVEEQVKRTPDIVAVVYSSDECQCDVKITYTEMWRRANQVVICI